MLPSSGGRPDTGQLRVLVADVGAAREPGLRCGGAHARPGLQVRYSTQGLLEYMERVRGDPRALEDVAGALLRVFEDNLLNDR